MAGEAPVVTPVVPAANLPVEPVIVPGSKEYDAAMIAKFEKNQNTVAPGIPAAGEAAIAPKPEGVPDKFYNAVTGVVDVVALAKSYTELEKTKATPKAVETPKVPAAPAALSAEQTAAVAALAAATTPEEKAAAEALKTTADAAAATANAANDKAAADAALASQGLNMQDFTDEYQSTGALSPESYAKLASKGIDENTVNAFIAGQHAVAQLRDAEGYAVAGSKEAFQKMAAWSASAMTVGERDAFNKAVSGSLDEMKLAVTGLRARYEAANGSAPTLLGGQGGNSSVDGYRSRAEMTAAMRDPRYAKDEAYRSDVERKVAASTAW